MRPVQPSMPNLILLTPLPPGHENGGSLRTWRLRQALQRHFEVTTLVLTPCPAPATGLRQTGDNLFALECETRTPPFGYADDVRLSLQIADLVQSRRASAIVSRYLWPACRATHGAGVPVLVDADDAVYRYPPGSGGPAAPFIADLKSWGRTFANRRALGRFEHCWFASSGERQQMPQTSSSVLPNVVDLAPLRQPGAAIEQRLLFVGAVWYGPNIAGLRWFLDEVWPTIRAARPAAHLRIVGAASPELRAQLERTPGVQCTGFVDDLAQEYAQASVAIAPIRHGGGTQIKVLEALAHGLPCVTTAFVGRSYQGLLNHEEELLIAEDAGLFAQQVLRLMGDAGLAQHLGEAGKVRVTAQFSTQAFDAEVSRTLKAMGLG